MMKCQIRSAVADDHSNPERDPEMFTVTHDGKATTQCLAHAMVSEALGREVQLILT